MKRDILDVLAISAMLFAVRVSLLPPEQTELLQRGALLAASRCCRAVALAAGTAGLRLEAAYQQQVSV